MKRSELRKLVREEVKKALLKENAKEKLIDKLLNTKYADDDPKYDQSNYKYLNSLPIQKLKKMIDDWDDYEER